MCGVDWFVLFDDGVCEFLLSYAFFSSATHCFRRHCSVLFQSFSFFLFANFCGLLFGANGGIKGSKGWLAALFSGVEMLLLLFDVVLGDFGAHHDAPFMNDSN